MTSLAVQEITTRAMKVMSAVQNFFSFHMLATYGCDLSTSGLNMDSVHSKVSAFFDQRTTEGPRFDTYLLYYSGDVFENGDWAFAGKFFFFLFVCLFVCLVFFFFFFFFFLILL
jgi:hypothetical protein